MLKPSQCFVGPVSDGDGMSLLLPREPQDERMLLFTLLDVKYAVMLESDFLVFEREGNSAWRGVHVTNVYIEIDPASTYISQGFRDPIGSLIRHGQSLSINGQRNRGGGFITPIPLIDNLPPCAADYAATFSKWQIVLGEGAEKQVLYQVDATPKLKL